VVVEDELVVVLLEVDVLDDDVLVEVIVPVRLVVTLVDVVVVVADGFSCAGMQNSVRRRSSTFRWPT